MLTPQEVSNRAFQKAIMGGYNMAMVDEFLDELTEDYTALFKENATLKAKMKVLVDKVEEYRATEDSMRAALLTAQKMSKSMVEEAEKKRDTMLADAEAAAREKLGDIRRELEEEQMRLDRAKAETAAFIEQIRKLYKENLDFLDTVPDLEVHAPTAEVTEATDVRKIEAQIMAAFDSGDEKKPDGEKPQESAAEEGKTAETAETAEDSAEETERPAEPAEKPADDDEENTFVRMLNSTPPLSDLKFGRNYRSED